MGQKGNGASQLGTVTEKMTYEDDIYQDTIGAITRKVFVLISLKVTGGSVTPDPHAQPPEVKPTLHTTQ